MTSDESLLCLLALARSPCMNARERSLVADVAGDARGLQGLGRSDLERLCGRTLRTDAWRPELMVYEARRDLDWMKAAGVRASAYGDSDYPPALRETARPPFLLFVRGRLPDPNRPAVAMVGTRYPTGRGLEAARRLAREAAEAGVTVVSGLARGIDAAAHRGCMEGGAPTFAVLGRGLDRVYPLSNKDLAAKMLASGGGLLSEYPPGTAPARWTFPERNRIIAGLCRSTLVVEAPKGSGALITADYALEEGRDVYIAADAAGGQRSEGSDALEADGALPVSCFKDVAADWAGAGRAALAADR
ncbi:MAG: DNA-processing protein DprA [Spirochaetales bacterium]|nr:DNA-processing protein DprA [Spirochaetales bacterium]